MNSNSKQSRTMHDDINHADNTSIKFRSFLSTNVSKQHQSRTRVITCLLFKTHLSQSQSCLFLFWSRASLHTIPSIFFIFPLASHRPSPPSSPTLRNFAVDDKKLIRNKLKEEIMRDQIIPSEETDGIEGVWFL